MSIQHLLDAAAVTEMTVTDPKTKQPVARAITSTHRLALMAIADDASDHTNLSWPGFEKICDWALVGDRRGHELVQDLITSGYLERVQKAHTGRRTVYLVKLPPRPRRAPVDNPQKEPAVGRTLSEKRVRSTHLEPAVGRTPLPINSPQTVNQSSTEPHPDARDRTTTTGFIAGLVGKVIPRRLDPERIHREVAGVFPDLAGDPAFGGVVERLTSEVLLKAPRGAHHPTAYVIAAFHQDYELQARLVTAVVDATEEVPR